MNNINKTCDFGCGRISNFTLKSGKSCCSQWCAQCPEIRRKNKTINKGRRPSNGTIRAVINANSNRRPWNYGLDKTDIRIKNQAKLLSDRLISGEIKRNCSDDTRKKLSHHAKNRKLGGVTKGGGVGKKGWYKGFWCDSSWELAYVIYNIDHGVVFKRNTEKFEYEYLGKTKGWFPDFIEKDGYIEIKGYMTKQVEAKINCFKKPLKLLMKDQLVQVFKYVTKRYGKDFIKLYDGERAGR